jgi:cell division protein FtsN
MSEPPSSNTYPDPEERKGDSSFLPVVVAAGVALIVILIAAILFIKSRQGKAIPTTHNAHPTSQIVYPPPPQIPPSSLAA